MKPFEMVHFAGWGDMDYNAHMRNTAYLDKSGDARMTFFSDSGFTMEKFTALRIGPVVMRDEVEYFREVGLLGQFSITMELAGLNADGSIFVLRNVFTLPNGKPAARVTSTGGWLDLAARKLVSPPREIRELMESLPRTADFTSAPVLPQRP